MTNKDLLNAMQNLEAKYTDEADERAENAYTRRLRKTRPLSAFAALGGAAACFALLFGLVHMSRSDAQFQTAESALSDVIAEETLPAEEADVPEKQTETEVTTPAEAAPETVAVYSYAPAETTTAAAKETAPVKKTTAPAKTEPAKATTSAAQTDPPAKPAQTTAPAAPSADETTAEAVQTEAPAPNETYTNPTLILDNVTAEAGAVVPVRVVIVNNPGVCTSGVRIYYDAALGIQTYMEEPEAAVLPEENSDTEQELPEFLEDPVDFFSELLGYDVTEEEAAEILEELKAENSEAWGQYSEQSADPAEGPTGFFGSDEAPTVKPTATFGSMTGQMQFSTSVNTDEHIVAYAFISNITSTTEDTTEDGEIITFYFIVPEDAESGTVYILTPDINVWCDSKFQSYEIDTVNGSITVK